MLQAELFAPAGYTSTYAERLAIVLGLITLGLALSTFLSCRSCVTLLTRMGWRDPTGNRAYRALYQFHSYSWAGFWLVLALHAMTGIMHAGLPSAIDPYSYLHKYILWSGAGATLVGLGVLSSCRSPLRFVDMFTSKPSLTVKGYRLFYRYHNYYWPLLFLLVATHFAVGYIHAGIWPH